MLKFIETLNVSDRDALTQVATELVAEGAPASLEHLKDALDKVKRQINWVNRQRQSLGAQVTAAERVLASLDRYHATDEDEKVLLLAFRYLLEARIESIQGRIKSLKPEDALEEKFKLKQQLQANGVWSKIGEQLIAALQSGAAPKP